jgi:glycosyltransferase involved in cell wall biosynthesis
LGDLRPDQGNPVSSAVPRCATLCDYASAECAETMMSNNEERSNIRAVHVSTVNFEEEMAKLHKILPRFERSLPFDAGLRYLDMGCPRPKVLMVGPWPPTKGGVTTFMRNVVSSELKFKYDFIRFTTSRPGKRNVKRDNYGYSAIFRGGLKRVTQGVVITLWHLLIYPWVVVARRPSVIQIQASDFQAFWEAALYVLLGKVLRRPIILRIGGSFDRFFEASGAMARAAIKWTLRQPSLLVVQSEYWKNYVDRLGGTGATVILNNFVPETLVEPRSGRSPAIPRFLLCCGELPRLKGAYVLLDAVRILIARGVKVDATLMAVLNPLRDEIVNTALDRHIRTLDFLSHDDALDALRRTDVFLQISSSEGFPNMLLEAMALGCATIVTPTGAVPEIVGADSECAFIIPPGDAAMLADRMARLIADRDLLNRMAAAAQARVLERFTERKVTPVLDKAYQFAMGERRHAPRAGFKRPI